MHEFSTMSQIIDTIANEAKKNDAEKIVFTMCNDLRIYNPVVHSCKIVAKGNIE